MTAKKRKITILSGAVCGGCGVAIAKHIVRVGSHDLECPKKKPMTPKERARMHRARERMHAKQVRYHLRHGLYVEAFRALAWALEQSTAAEAAEREGSR